jgi:hypothetical protein
MIGKVILAAAAASLAFSTTLAVADECADWRAIGEVAATLFSSGQPGDMPGAQECGLEEGNFWCEFDRGQDSATESTGYRAVIDAIKACFAGASAYEDTDEDGNYAFITTGRTVFYVEDADGIVSVNAGRVK